MLLSFSTRKCRKLTWNLTRNLILNNLHVWEGFDFFQSSYEDPVSMDYPFTGTVNHSFKGNFQWGVQSFHGLLWFNLSSSFDWSRKLAFISQSVVQNLDHWRRCCSYLPQVQITYLFLFDLYRVHNASLWYLSSFWFAIAITEVSISRRSAQMCSITFIGFVVFCTVYCSNPYNILLLASCTVVRSWCGEQQRGRAGCCTSS